MRFFLFEPQDVARSHRLLLFPKTFVKTRESELLFARDSKVSKILKWRTFYAPLKEPSSLEQHSRRMVDIMRTGPFRWLARIIP